MPQDYYDPSIGAGDGAGGGFGGSTPPPPSIFDQVNSLLGTPGGGTFYDQLEAYNTKLGTLNFGNIDPSGYQDQLSGIGRDFAGATDASQGQYAQLLASLGGLGQRMTGAGTGQQQLEALSGQLGGLGQRMTGAGTGQQQLQGLSGQLGGMGQQYSQRMNELFGAQSGIAGGNDPRFAQFAQGQMGLLESQKTQDMARINEAMAQRGLSGSTLALNEQNKLSNQYNQQQQNLIGSLGMQQMGRQDQSLQNMAGLAQGQAGTTAGLYGQQAGLYGQQFNQGQQGNQQLMQLLGMQGGLYGQQFNQGQQGNQQLMQLLGMQGGVIGQQSGLDLARMQGLAGLAGQGFGGGLSAGQFNQQSQDMQGQTWQSMLQNGTLPIQFLIAAEAAQNAGQPGKSSDDGGGGILSQIFGGL